MTTRERIAKGIEFELTSVFWRILVDATKEEKVFDSFAECKAWAASVRTTFMDESMTFTITQVAERTTKL